MVETFLDLRSLLNEREARIKRYDERLRRAAKDDPRAGRLMEAPGWARLYGITKRGDTYLRTLLIDGARSALRR